MPDSDIFTAFVPMPASCDTNAVTWVRPNNILPVVLSCVSYMGGDTERDV